MRALLFCALFALTVAVPVDHIYQPKSDMDLKCTLCKEVVTIAEKQLQKNGTEEAIKNAIDQVCSVIEKHVPGAAALCEAVDDNIDQIIQLLESEVTPEEVCKLVHLCENTEPVVMTPPLTDNCDTCKQMVGVVENLIQSNTTEAEIQVLVGDACTLIEKYLPQAKAECDFVQNNIPTIIGLIVSEVTPEEICSLIGQCSKGHVAAPVDPTPKLHMPFDNCDTCKEIVQLVEGELEQNATIAELRTLVNETCTFVEKYVPQIAAECQLVEDNLEQIVSYLVNAVTPEEACTLIGVCKSKAVSAILKAAKMKHLDIPDVQVA